MSDLDAFQAFIDAESTATLDWLQRTAAAIGKGEPDAVERYQAALQASNELMAAERVLMVYRATLGHFSGSDTVLGALDAPNSTH